MESGRFDDFPFQTHKILRQNLFGVKWILFSRCFDVKYREISHFYIFEGHLEVQVNLKIEMIFRTSV